MRSLTAKRLAEIASGTTTDAFFMRIVRPDSVTFGLTTHVENMVLDSVTYYSTAGYTPSASSANDTVAVNYFDFSGLLDSDVGITRGDIQAGLFYNARVTVFVTNYNDPVVDEDIRAAGFLGRASLMDGRYQIEYRSLAQKLQQSTGRLITQLCPYQLGETACGVNLASYTTTGSVTTVTSQFQFVDSSRAEADDYFTAGNITWTTGLNAGYSMKVKKHTGTTIKLSQQMPNNIQVGDQFSISAGCQQRYLADCRTKFSNGDNFGGFPYVPTQEQAGTVGGQEGVGDMPQPAPYWVVL